MEQKEKYLYFNINEKEAAINFGDGTTDCIVVLNSGNDAEQLSALNKSFRIIVAHLDNVEPIETEEYTIVPTLNEAEDYLFMQQIERDLMDEI